MTLFCGSMESELLRRGTAVRVGRLGGRVPVRPIGETAFLCLILPNSLITRFQDVLLRGRDIMLSMGIKLPVTAARFSHKAECASIATYTYPRLFNVRFQQPIVFETC